MRCPWYPALMASLCLALVGTPVSYRGGAAAAHPHMFLEFVLDARSGSFTHHHPDEPDTPDQAHSDGHTHEHEPSKRETTKTDPEPVQPRVAGADIFAPTLSAFVVGDVSQLALLLPQDNLAPARDVSNAFHRFFSNVTGLDHAPAAPPPR